jgi:DNA-directed RNA polymerase I subunit RPA43
MPSLIPSPAKEKSGRKHKSNDEKKRKRDREHGEDGHKHKSKKHRSDKPVGTAEVAAIAETNPDHPKESPFHIQTSTLYLPLAPISQRQPREGLCAEHLSPLILTYYPPFDGVILSYSNVRISEQPYGNDGNITLLKCIDEYAVSWAWVTAEFVLFKPMKGCWLEGYVNLQNEGHLGLVCWNLFNASIERKRLPKDWKWVGVADAEPGADENYAEHGVGHWVDGDGKKVDGTIKFRVRDIESNHDRERGFLSIAGTMLPENEEKALQEQETGSKEKNKSFAGKRLGGAMGLGATSLGVPSEQNPEDAEGGKKRRRDY